MMYLLGIDKAKRMRQAGVFSDAITEPGTLIAREVIKDVDIFNAQANAANQAAGARSVNIGAFGANYLYKISFVDAFYISGTCTVVKIWLSDGANVNYLAVSPSLAVNIPLLQNTNLWCKAGWTIGADFTVTVQATIVIGVGYIRTPYPT